jgi:hypothetical protein
MTSQAWKTEMDKKVMDATWSNTIWLLIIKKGD